jgi:F0F1-type ATP synthase assembly protein I
MAGAEMHDDANQDPNDGEAPISVPTHTPLPPPPVVSYTRPPLSSRSANLSPPDSPRPSGAEKASGGSGLSSLGAGLAGATTFVASVIAGLLIGQWIDHRWNHAGGTPWGTLIFALLGVAAGFLNLFRVLAATDRKQDKK